MTGLPRRVVIDTDPGVDDALAIAIALASPELDVTLLTTVFGNAATDITTRNALGLLALADRACIPVLSGAVRPLVTSYHGAVPQVHGHDGLGDNDLLERVSLPAPKDTAAALGLVDAAKRAHADGVPVTIVTLGPLTNLALALALDPNFDTRVARVVTMGGNAFAPGNATPTAEANMMNDPEAADRVLGARWPVTMIGLDVTHRVNLTGTMIDTIAAADTFGGRIAREGLPLYQSFFERTNGIDGIFAHDPSVIAWLLDPDLFSTRALPIRVERHGISRGKTWPSLGDTDDACPAPWINRTLVDVATDVRGELVADLVVERLRGTQYT